MNEWISIVESVPSENNYYICTYGNEKSAIVDKLWWEHDRWLYSEDLSEVDEDNGNKIIAWMPLPKPYKASKK